MIVAGLAGMAFWQVQIVPVESEPVLEPATAAPQATLQPVQADAPALSILSLPAIGRQLTLKTNIPERPRYAVLQHTVMRGDSIFRLSKEFNLKPETVLWANYEVLADDPHSLKPGQELYIPPTDGILYQWQAGDTLEKIAIAYQADLEQIISWPGNDLDLADPQPQPEQWVMVPDGWRESKAITIQVDARVGGSGSGNSCGSGGPVGSGFIFPTGSRFVSGNDYFPGHLAIDLAATEGDPVYASASGVVVKAASGWNGGYGNVVAIDHGNGYVTLYAHLSQINVSLCQGVGAGQVIGLAGNTGNSFGAHLHFEVRQGGGNINPWYVLQ